MNNNTKSKKINSSSGSNSSSSSSSSGSSSSASIDSRTPYPGFAPTSFKYLTQDSKPVSSIDKLHDINCHFKVYLSSFLENMVSSPDNQSMVRKDFNPCDLVQLCHSRDVSTVRR